MSNPDEQSTTPALSPRAIIYRKIAAVAAQVERIDKDGKNKHKDYRYATLPAIFATLKPLLAEQQLALLPRMVEHSEQTTTAASSGGAAYVLTRVQMLIDICCGDTGDSISLPWSGESGRYNDDKGIASAQTVCLRTFLINAFQLPCFDPDTDPDAQEPEPPGRKRNASASEQMRQPQRSNTTAQQSSNADALSSKQYGLIKGLIEQGGWSDESTIEWCEGLGMGKLDTLRDLSKSQATQLIDRLKHALAAAQTAA